MCASSKALRQTAQLSSGGYVGAGPIDVNPARAMGVNRKRSARGPVLPAFGLVENDLTRVG